jgi:hypothetical protein
MARRALLLANDSFADSTIPPLMSPCSDGEKLRDLLIRDDVGGYDITYCANANSVEARIAVQRFFREANAGDFNLILISGHGIRDSQGHLHFATADTHSDWLAATSLESAFVIKQMDLSSASKQVAIIDTCFSGAFVQGMTAKAATQRITIADFNNSEHDNTRGRAVITASTRIQSANENAANGTTQSVFTRHLIEGIETGAADADGDGEIGLPELFDYISARLRAEGSVQTPQSYDYGLAGKVVVALNPAHRPATLPPALLKKLQSRNVVQRGDAVRELRSIALNDEAREDLALQELRKLTENDDSTLVRGAAREALAILAGMETPLDAYGVVASGAAEPPSAVKAGRNSSFRIVAAVSVLLLMLIALLLWWNETQKQDNTPRQPTAIERAQLMIGRWELAVNNTLDACSQDSLTTIQIQKAAGGVSVNSVDALAVRATGDWIAIGSHLYQLKDGKLLVREQANAKEDAATYRRCLE